MIIELKNHRGEMVGTASQNKDGSIDVEVYVEAIDRFISSDLLPAKERQALIVRAQDAIEEARLQYSQEAV